MTTNLRPYQAAAIQAALTALAAGHAPLLVLPTGTGKTVIFAKIAEAVRPQGRTLVLAHREELIDQAEGKIEDWTGLLVGVEMAERRGDGAGDLLGRAPDVVVASVQSLARRLDRYPRDAFHLIVTDESHHATAATYRKIYEYFASARRLGVTATPDRTDGAALKAIFDCAPYVYELRDAIEDGWLTPIRQYAVTVRMDLSDVRTTAGDLHEGDLEDVLCQPRALDGIAGPLVEQAKGRTTLVFAATVKHAEALGQTMQQYAEPGAVRWVSGRDTKADRRQIVADFRAARFPYLVNCLLFTEGFDEPGISCVAVARPTKSRSLYAQMIGRGTRLHPFDAAPLTGLSLNKPELLILDFKGNAGRHMLVNTLDVLDGNQDAGVAAKAQAKMQRGMTALAAMSQAEAELAEEQKQRDLARARVSHTLVAIDPFAILGIRPRVGRWNGAPMSVDLRDSLLRHKVPLTGLDRGAAEEVWATIQARSKQGRCTLRQAMVLARKGIDPERLTFAQASSLIDRIAANGWRVPVDLAVTG